jgi:hypothetical protein
LQIPFHSCSAASRFRNNIAEESTEGVFYQECVFNFVNQSLNKEKICLMKNCRN